ncbi:hypothetical protein HBI56_216920 [Parastagonospora nodorum]|nr:hypothetical protein HBH53_000270 [Parastagonospora nodorum]KAH3965594.1 hypothetical protein HBH52_204110 [Parastagonospora nodorum]KAH3971391.1 hypothetical protein HBH51_109820 [Parastagonospora nodorum]KAH4007807.1 hypothetical protein HBI10_009730 [Parastagonospora nodorum]KAH4023669.1 hypothetical protein HBI13_091440 [Parastagonospora nodorum]
MEREPPWTEHERVYLLCEVLKASPVSSQALLSFLREAQIQPRWSDTALPPGRSLRSSQMAFDTLAATYAGSDYRRPPMPAGPQPIMYAGPEASRKRPYQEAAPPIGRLLQPRPPQPYPGEYIQAAGPAYGSNIMSSGEPANKKKRGRPTKAEAQQRAQEAAARGEVYPPPRRGRVSITAPPEPSPLGSESQPQERTPPQQAARASHSTMTPPRQTQPDQEEESSSGKRRRTKPEPLELEKPQRTLGEMESPLAYGSGDPSRNQAYMSYTPISAPLPGSADSRDRDIRMEGVEETQPRTTTPHSFKDTVGI